MKKHLFGAALVLCLVAISGMAMAQTIDQIQYYNPETGAPESPYDGTQVTVEGTIYVVKGTYNGGTHYMQGATGGISFFSSSITGLDYGTEVEVTGEVSAYAGEIQLASPSIAMTGQGVEPTPQEKTPEEVLYDYELIGNFVSVIGEVSSVSGNSRFELTAGDSTLVCYVDSDTQINLGDVNVGDTYKVLSPCVVYNGLIELKPRKQGDLIENPTGDTAPVIDQINCANWVPMAVDPITVTAVITDNSAVASASVYYRDSDGETPGSWSSVAMSNTFGDNYSATIPGGHGSSQVDFYVEATDDGAQTVTNPGDAPAGFLSVAVGITSIYDMQYAHPDSVSGAAAYDGKFLNIRGVVTAGTTHVGSPSKFIVQEVDENPETNSYAFGGVLVYEGTAAYSYYQGDLVEIGGICDEYNNLTEMIPHNANAVNLLDFSQDLPEASRVSTRDLADDSLADVDGNGRMGEAWESVWVETFPATVVDTLGYGEYIISDTGARADSLVVNPITELTYLPIINDVLVITSYMEYSYGDFQIVPTSDESIVIYDPSSVDDTPVMMSAGGFRSIAPNPFNPSTTIKFAVNRDNLVQLNVYNIRGEKVRTLVQDNLPMNEYTFVWDGKADNGQTVSSGHYFARLRIGAEVVQVRKMALIK